jgi:hypothetical protein
MQRLNERILGPIQGLFWPARRNKSPLLSAAELTRLSWSRRVESLEGIPEIYRDLFQELTGRPGAFPYTVFVPAYGGFGGREQCRLIFCYGQEIYILECSQRRPVASCYPIANLNAIETGRILLCGWITLRGISREGAPTLTTVMYNAVNEHLFAPFILPFRQAPTPPRSGANHALELNKFDYLLTLNFKFMSYAKACLLPGDQVIESLLQPEIREPALQLWRKTFFRTVCTTHLLILTDRELILLQDGHLDTGRKGKRYGAGWTFIPLCKIAGVAQAPQEPDRLQLSVRLPGEDQIDVLFSASSKATVDQLVADLDAARGALDR